MQATPAKPQAPLPSTFRRLAKQPDLPPHLVACTCTWCIRGKLRGADICPKCGGDHIRVIQISEVAA